MWNLIIIMVNTVDPPEFIQRPHHRVTPSVNLKWKKTGVFVPTVHPFDASQVYLV